MATRDQVLSMLNDSAAASGYSEIARSLGVPAGQAYMIATGLPADGSDSLAPEDLERPGLLEGSTQFLSNPSAENPTSKEHVLDWLKERARSDAAMRDAFRRRDAEPGEPQRPEDKTDIADVLTRDHDRMTALLEELSAIPGKKQGGSESDLSRRESIVDMITVSASRHESVEEEYFWPTVREILPKGEELAAGAIAQEQEAAETLAALGKHSPDEEEFDGLVEKLVMSMRKHVAFEDKVLMALRSAVKPEDRQGWGEKVRKQERLAPTRPHPHAPRSPAPAVKAAGAAGAALDALRDAAGNRPAKRKGKPEEASPEE
jgi:hypothetical protein